MTNTNEMPIKGYRTLSSEELALVNRIKAAGDEIGEARQ